MMSESDAAWLSGFIDGEGHVGLHSQTVDDKTYYQPVVHLRHTHSETMDHVSSLLAGIEIVVPIAFEQRGERHKDSYRLTVTRFDRILRLADAVEPHSVTKIAQWSILRQWCESRLSAAAKAGYSPEERAIAAIGVEMNRRGKVAT